MDITKELPTIAATRMLEWQIYWTKRIARYWSLGSVNPRNYWRE